MSIAVKNCPFCGQAAKFCMDQKEIFHVFQMWVECQGCGVRGYERASSIQEDYEAVVDMWNRRADTALREEQ